MNNLKPLPLTAGILRVLVIIVIIYGLAGAVLELWNLNIIPGRLQPGLLVSLGMVLLWGMFIWLDMRASPRMKRALFNGALVLIMALLAVYASTDRAGLTTRLSGLAMNWCLAGFGIALWLRVRRGREERVN